MIIRRRPWVTHKSTESVRSRSLLNSNVSSQDLLLISYPRFKVSSANLVQHMTVLRRWKFWEYLPLLASVAGCSWLWISASLSRRKLSFWRWKKRGDRAKRRMRSQQESCCGLAFTGLNGLKLIWNSALSLIALEFFFSHQTSSCVPSRLELKTSFWICFLLSGTSASGCLLLQKPCFFFFFASDVSHCHCELTFTRWSEFNTHADVLLQDWFWCEHLPTGSIGADSVGYQKKKKGFNSLCENDKSCIRLIYCPLWLSR